jgi:hypothetical protein
LENVFTWDFARLDSSFSDFSSLITKTQQEKFEKLKHEDKNHCGAGSFLL